MIEVAIAAVEAVFDWRAFQGLKEEEPLDVPEQGSGQTDVSELEELDDELLSELLVLLEELSSSSSERDDVVFVF